MSKMSETELRRRLELLAGVDPSPEATRRALDRVRRTLDQADTWSTIRTPGLWRILMRGKTAALAAAAVLMMGYVMFVSIPSAQAVTFAQIREALQKAGNVCIASLLPNHSKPVQTQWVSRPLNLCLFHSCTGDPELYALWDVSNRKIYIRPVEGGEVESKEMSDEAFARVQKQLARATGLVPFDEIGDLPEGSTWKKVTDPNVAALVPGTEVYDLVWTVPIPTIPPSRRTELRRFFVDPRTHLPLQLEIYSQDPREPKPICYKTFVMTFPTDMEIQTLAQTMFPGLTMGVPVRQP